MVSFSWYNFWKCYCVKQKLLGRVVLSYLKTQISVLPGPWQMKFMFVRPMFVFVWLLKHQLIVYSKEALLRSPEEMATSASAELGPEWSVCG